MKEIMSALKNNRRQITEQGGKSQRSKANTYFLCCRCCPFQDQLLFYLGLISQLSSIFQTGT